MNKKKKQIIYNVLTVVIIAVMVIAAVFVTKKIKAGGSKPDVASSTDAVKENAIQQDVSEEQPDSTSVITDDQTTEVTATEAKTTEEVAENGASGSAGSHQNDAVTTETKPPDDEGTETKPTEAVTTEATTEAATEEKVMSCTVYISCSAVLDNMDNLKEGKEEIIPSSGVILGTVNVTFTQGETAFDVLKRTCSSYGIQLEYSYTPAYGSYYVEGINNLYEFDCGSGSGWTFYINGASPNRGCSSYIMSDGDSMVWSYYCR